MDWSDPSVRKVLREMFSAAVASADPHAAVLKHLPERPKGRCIVVGAGKASAAMAAAIEVAWGDVDISGVVVTRYGHAVPSGRVQIIEASHPVPDSMSVEAAARIQAAVRGLKPQDLVLALVSGGGSSLLVSPAGDMTLEDKIAINAALLSSGATISEINTVRKHLSGIKGGRLAQLAQPARVVSLIISDVPGDGLSEVASGPTVPDPTTVEDAREVIARYRLNLPAAAQSYLAWGRETPKPGEIDLDARIIASPSLALKAAADVALRHGLTPCVLGDALEGEAKELGRIMAGISRSVKTHGLPVAGPAVLLSGGEATVSLGSLTAGRGGRNTEFLLALALDLKSSAGIWAIAADTDGIDGVENAAGALVGPTTLSKFAAAGIDPRVALAGHDSYTAFSKIDDLIVTGPTRTNVNDFRAILVR